MFFEAFYNMTRI